MATEAEAARTFVGRPETVAALHRRFEDVRAGTGGVTLLVGDTGVGKSALVAELLGDIRAHHTLLMVGRALALDDPPPFSLLRAAIESVRGAAGPGADDAASRDAHSFPIGFAPLAREGPVPAPVTIETRLLDALGGSDERNELSREQVLSRIADQFLEFTQHTPAVLVLEDLHRADESSLAAVEFLADQLKNQPLWILATCRPSASLSESGRARLEGFESATKARQILLRPMNSSEVGDYLRMNEPSHTFSPEEVARRYSETGGNPLLLQQLEHRTAPAAGPYGAPEVPLPELDPEAQRALDVAAVLGPESTFALLLRASGEEDEERFVEAIDRLVARGLLYERSGEILAFPEDRLREEAYARLPEKRRRLLHWSAGETLEAMGSGGLANIYALARHFYLGRVGQKSVHYNRVAAEIAERALAPDVARDHLARALESLGDLLPRDVAAESELVLELARVTEEHGGLKEAEEILRSFLDREKDDPHLLVGRRATLEIFLCRVLVDRGDVAAASALAKKVLDTPGLDDQLLVRVGAHHQLGIGLYYTGHYQEALDHHTEELRLARKVGNVLVIVQAQIWRVAALSMMGETEQAIAGAREATVVRDGLGSVRESAHAHLFLGDILADARSPPSVREEALGEYAKVIRFGEEAKDPRRVAWALYKTAELLRETARHEEAAEKAQEACELFQRIGDQVGLSVSLKVRAQIAMDRGAYGPAEADLLEAHRLLRGLHHTLEEIDVLLRLAQLSQARGNPAGARGHLAELERLDLRTTRPDLAEEFELLRQALGAGEEGHGTP
jgi:tetratricopeptide (TPR) repeat protein